MLTVAAPKTASLAVTRPGVGADTLQAGRIEKAELLISLRELKGHSVQLRHLNSETRCPTVSTPFILPPPKCAAPSMLTLYAGLSKRFGREAQVRLFASLDQISSVHLGSLRCCTGTTIFR